jgi:NCAIR mutase (PurE)-related protein
LAAVKSPEMVVESLRRLATACDRAVATRCTHEHVARVQQDLGRAFDVTWHDDAHAIVVAMPGSAVPCLGGNVGILTAGSSDASAAAEAALIACEMGANVREVRDVGVAGLHRLVKPLEQLIDAGVDVLIVVAGMDGALASVVAGLVPVPVIGLPTSIGYGHGGGGVGALMSMLQSCAPGLVVVNIDNGVGAGSTAALIANRMAAARHATESRHSP